MRKLLPLLAVALAVPTVASAQSWNFARVFPDSSQRKAHDNPHGIAVDGEGKVWIQPYYPRSGDSVAVPGISAAVKQIAGAVYVFKADGTPASFSPILFASYPGGGRDTVGGATIVNSTGGKAWAQIGGRGLTADQNGDIVAAFNAATNANNISRLIKFDHKTGAGISRANLLAYGLPNTGPAAPAADRNGRVYVTGVFPGDPIVMLNGDLSFRENVTAADAGFTRASGVSATGDSVYHLAYDKLHVLRYKRPDEFSSFNATPDTLLRGIAAEAFTRNPKTRDVWFGAGSSTNVPNAPYFRNKWYAFREADLGQAFPTKRDSIVWNGTTSTGGPSDGRPRGIAFSPDGMSAYVAQFSNTGGELYGVRKYTNMTVGVDGFGRWVPDDVLVTVGPNPTRGTTTIRYQGISGASVRIELYDVAGRLVQTLVDGVQAAGEQSVSFDTAGMAAGVYYVRYSADGAVVTRPVSVIR